MLYNYEVRIIPLIDIFYFRCCHNLAFFYTIILPIYNTVQTKTFDFLPQNCKFMTVYRWTPINFQSPPVSLFQLNRSFYFINISTYCRVEYFVIFTARPKLSASLTDISLRQGPILQYFEHRPILTKAIVKLNRP